MLVVKDAMVLIHLAKAALLETSCDYFGSVIIPQLVHKEVLQGEHPDARVIADLVTKGKIDVQSVSQKLVNMTNEFNIQRGEAEAVALYWEMKASLLATDDNNVRTKKDILKLRVIGTPAIMLMLYRKKKIRRERLFDAIRMLKETGWFSSTVWDKIYLEVKHD